MPRSDKETRKEVNKPDARPRGPDKTAEICVSSGEMGRRGIIDCISRRVAKRDAILMLFEFLTGAGVKLLSNVIQSIFSNAAEERRNRELQDQDVANAHVELAKIHQKDNVVKIERLIVFWALVGTFCYISYAHIGEVAHDSVVLVDRNIGWVSRMFTQAKQGAVKVSGATFIFELWSNLIVMILGAYTIPPRRQ